MSSVHGLLLVNKEIGCTSHDIVDRVREIFHIREVGHCGTLDPMASGLMVMLLGEATKLSQYILEKDKGYRLTAQLGITTDTLDKTGKILTESKADFPETKLREMVTLLQGEYDLPVPLYSAVKVDGYKLHEYARRNQEVQRPNKRMKFFDFKNLDVGPDWVSFDMRCSKGSYVRAWIQYFGEMLGCGAAMSALNRTYSTPYGLDQAQTLEQIQSDIGAGRQPSSFIPMGMALPDYKFIRVSGFDQKLIQNGQISHDVKSQLISIFKPGQDIGVKILEKMTGELLAIVGLEEGKGFVIRRAFRY
ncbi:MAG: tRNA pseudouridine synthase B [Oligoflexia bacterium]|nr:MAG: tRNA pseudouridine synthase B [Oligoflexia bacterium]